MLVSTHDFASTIVGKSIIFWLSLICCGFVVPAGGILWTAIHQTQISGPRIDFGTPIDFGPSIFSLGAILVSAFLLSLILHLLNYRIELHDWGIREINWLRKEKVSLPWSGITEGCLEVWPDGDEWVTIKGANGTISWTDMISDYDELVIAVTVATGIDPLSKKVSKP